MRKRFLVVVAILLAVSWCFYLACIHYTEAYQVGIRWNYFSGELSQDTHAGFHFTPPWVKVSRIDTRPQRVCITSAGRGYNCKLVQFEQGAWREFVAVQGFHYWWLANRISFNAGYDEEYRGMKDLLRGYAFSAKKYPFINVLRDYTEQ